VREHERAVLLVHVLVQSQTRRCSGEHLGECSLARAQRLKAKVITIDLDQVEGPHEDALVMPSVSDAIERREPVVVLGTPITRCRLIARSKRRSVAGVHL
jgi:hypothetical protein